MYLTCIRSGADEDAIDTTLYRETHATGNATNPLGLARESEVNHAVVERTAASLLVNHLNLEKHHVGTIGLRALRILDGGELQLTGFADSFQLVAAAIGSNGLECAWLKGDIIESEEVAVTLTALAE